MKIPISKSYCYTFHQTPLICQTPTALPVEHGRLAAPPATENTPRADGLL